MNYARDADHMQRKERQGGRAADVSRFEWKIWKSLKDCRNRRFEKLDGIRKKINSKVEASQTGSFNIVSQPQRTEA